MKKVLIIGATGSIGQVTTEYLLQNSSDELSLFARHISRLHIQNTDRVGVIAGDVLDNSQLTKAMIGQDAIFVALSGNLGKMATCIVQSMQAAKVKRLVFITSMGIYNEIPASIGANGNLQSNPMLQTYRDAADVVEASDLDYTIVRPGWFDSGKAKYQVTQKGEPFGGHNVAREAIADLVMHAIDDDQYVDENIGINRL